MKKKDQDLLNKFRGNVAQQSVYSKMCKDLKVTKAGAGYKIYRLLKDEYKHENYD